MNRSIILLLGFLLLGSPAWVWGQDAQEEMRFVEELRNKGYGDLALEYLEKLQKNPSPELARQLPFEIAKTRVEAATQEADSRKRKALYNQAREEFEKFLKANPDDPRTPEATFEIAQIAVLQARNQMSVAFMSEASEVEETADMLKARAMLEAAGQELQKVLTDIEVKLAALGTPSTPLDKRKHELLTEQKLQADLTFAVNLFDQARTYPIRPADESLLVKRGEKVEDAQRALEKLIGESAESPAVWEAKAWLGRCQHQAGEPNKARETLAGIIALPNHPPAASANRLARYFRMLVIEEFPQPDEDKFALINDGTQRWMADYPRYLNTREGTGVMFLRARIMLTAYNNPMFPQVRRDAYLALARQLLARIEQTENEFTDRARRMKLGIIAQQGGFSKKVEELKNFEDCYVRAQYEMLEMNRDPQKAEFALQLIQEIPKSMDAKKKLSEFEELAKALRDLPSALTPAPVKTMAVKLDTALKMEDDAKRDEALKAIEPTLKDLETPLKSLDEEKMRETRTATIMAALERGLGLPEAKGKASPEIDNARAMLTFYYLNAAGLKDGGVNVARLRDAIRIGEEFARTNPRAGQAASAASYCMQAYSQLIASYGDMADESVLKQEVDKMRDFAGYIKLRWSSEFVADMARHQLALLALREKKVPEAIKELEEITPDYPTYAGTQFLLANTALAAERDGLPLIPGDQPGAYRQRALKALETIPIPQAGAEPANNQAYVHAKSLLAQELFKEKKYPQMQQITDTLLAKLPTLRMSGDDEENQRLREDFTNSLKVIALFGLYGEANIAFQAKDYAKTAGMLDTLIDQINDDKYPQIKTNQQLGQALVVMAMQSNLHVGKLDRARLAAQALQVAVAEGVGGGDLPLGLRIVMGVIDGRIKEIEAKKDPAELAKTVKGLDAILQDLVAKEKKPTPKFFYAVAQAYMLMKDFKNAAEFAQKIEEPKAPTKPAEVTTAEDKNLVADPVLYKDGVEKDLNTLRTNNAPQSQIDAVSEYISKLDSYWNDHKLYQAGQLLGIRMLRLNKELAKAREGINKALGDKENPGWGAKNIETQVEHLRLYVDEEDFYHGFLVGQKLVEALVSHADRSPRIKDFYLEGYYLMSYCYLRQAQKQTVASKRASAMKTTAQLILQLERKYSDFGGGEWGSQMKKMIDGEPELKAEYDALKAM